MVWLCRLLIDIMKFIVFCFKYWRKWKWMKSIVLTVFCVCVFLVKKVKSVHPINCLCFRDFTCFCLLLLLKLREITIIFHFILVFSFYFYIFEHVLKCLTWNKAPDIPNWLCNCKLKKTWRFWIFFSINVLFSFFFSRDLFLPFDFWDLDHHRCETFILIQSKVSSN